MTESNGKFINVTSLGALASHGINRVAIAIGVFDGVHRGHQALLDELRQMSEKENATPVALTFFPHPREVIGQGHPPRLLIPPFLKVELLHYYGMQAVVTFPFTRDFAALEPDAFIKDCLLAPGIELCGICVGSKWRFGANGAGTVETLEAFADKGHFKFSAVDEIYLNGEEISSTVIRQAIASGLLDKAREMLGRPYTLCGTVEEGHHVAGSELEHPTANLKMKYGVFPPSGVYAGKVILQNKPYQAAINIGISPTYNRPEDRHKRMEVHLLDYKGLLYGQDLRVELHEYLREERSFPSVQALKVQIVADIDRIRQLVKV